jgi:hypothetical protein
MIHLKNIYFYYSWRALYKYVKIFRKCFTTLKLNLFIKNVLDNESQNGSSSIFDYVFEYVSIYVLEINFFK